MQSFFGTLPDGDPQQTIAATAVMRQLAIQGAADPLVRATAVFIVDGQGRDQTRFAQAIAGWVAQFTRFMYDPSPFETFTSPATALQLIDAHGTAPLDCDCTAILVAALGLSVGLRARFVVVSFYTPDAPYEHVWCELGDTVGNWLPVDPTRPDGYLPPVVRAPMIVEV